MFLTHHKAFSAVTACEVLLAGDVRLSMHIERGFVLERLVAHLALILRASRVLEEVVDLSRTRESI